MKLYRLTALICAAALALCAGGCSKQAADDPAASASSSGPKLPELVYAEGTTAISDSEEMQEAYRKAIEEAQQGIAIEYQGQAFSQDGENFTCHIGNPDANDYDMFIAIYADEDGNMGEELFLSGLARPGTAFEDFKTEKKLEKGTHLAYLLFTQVEDDHETMHGQTTVTIELVVQ